MKRFNWLLVGLVVLCLLIISLTGCVSKSEYEALQADYQVLQDENTTLKAELQAAQSDLTNLRGDYDALNTDYQAASEELAKIKKVYPPKYFDSYDKLKDWVDEHCPITYGPYNLFKKHLELQEKALADGYIWSVYTKPDGTGIISCVVAGDSVYYVWLDGYIEWAYWR